MDSVQNSWSPSANKDDLEYQKLWIDNAKLLIISNIDYVNESLYPTKAVEYIKENIDYKNMRVYNSYNFGSYLMLHDIPVFIDSRADLYTNYMLMEIPLDVDFRTYSFKMVEKNRIKILFLNGKLLVLYPKK